MEERILIVNTDGLFSALPTPEEYKGGTFVTENMVVGRVKVPIELSNKIHLVKSQIRVLSPELPPPNQDGLFRLAIVNGVLIAV